MSNARPDLAEIWYFEKNDELGLSFYKTTKGSDKIAWWMCFKCRDSYDMVVKCKATLNQQCPYCMGKRANHTNSLAALRPDLASEWHPILNGRLTPHDVTCGSSKIFWWLGKCSHYWDMSLTNRTTHNQNCPYCCIPPKRILVGFNDMKTTNPKLAELLLNPEDGYKYTQSSGDRVDWRCLNCKEIVRNKRIADINRYGLSCPKCSDGISYNEKFFYCMLSQLNISFDTQVSFSWSEDKRYDFYLPKYNAIIETHGKQHYEESGFSEMSGISLENQKVNDKYKYEIAMQNGIDKYIIIDCRKSDIEWIKNSILSSELAKIFDLSDIDWIECNRYATKSLVIETCNYWKNNDKPSTEFIAEVFKISRATVIKYLKIGKKNEWCDYTTPIENKKNRDMLYGKREKRVIKKLVQLELSGLFIKEWNSTGDIFRELGIDRSSIYKVCKGEIRTAGGFKWMYKEDYDKLVESK